MKRAKNARRDVLDFGVLSDGLPHAIPLDEAVSTTASQLRRLAAATDDPAERHRLSTQAYLEEQLARELVRRRFTSEARSAGGATTGEARALAAKTRHANIIAAAQQIKQTEPDIKLEALAAMLHDRGHGGKEAIRKILIRAAKP